MDATAGQSDVKEETIGYNTGGDPSTPASPQLEPAPGDASDQLAAQAAASAENVSSPSKKDKGSKLPAEKGDKQATDRLVKVKGLDKQQLCIDLLMVGCVQSYVDFFYITHRKPAPSDNSDQESKHVDIPEETLIFLKETLETAEMARRHKTYQQCFENYNELAEYFETVNDLHSAMYFHRRCSDVATEVDARESIAKANLSLGSCEERNKNWESAMSYHQKALHIAVSADSLPLQIKAASNLTHVFDVLADLAEKEGNDTKATSLLDESLKCAHMSKDAGLEGMACHKLGLSLYKTGKYDQAIELQKQYLEICNMQDDRVGESAARAALAQCYEATGNAQEAIKQLENLLNVASDAGELKSQASACLSLGILYSSRGDHDKSVELLEQHFDLARQLGDRKLIDSARVVLGMVRGNGKIKHFIDVVNNDLERLLKWKSKRASLDSY
jgi:tetratricopeptide (TPR) repeat protein